MVHPSRPAHHLHSPSPADVRRPGLSGDGIGPFDPSGGAQAQWWGHIAEGVGASGGAVASDATVVQQALVSSPAFKERLQQHVALHVGHAKRSGSSAGTPVPPPSKHTVLVGSTRVDYLGLIASNIGAVVMPFMLFFQQSAVVDKGLRVCDLKLERIETAVGSCLTQLIMIAVIITMAAPFYYAPLHGHLLPSGLPTDPGDWSIHDFAAALYPHFGKMIGDIIFSVGMLGGAAVGAIVVSLTAAWGVGEVTGWSRSLSVPKWEARWFYLFYILTVFLAAGIVLLPGMSGPGLVKLNLGIQQLNALLLPIVLGMLFQLARRAIPDESLRLKGLYAALCAFVFGSVCLIAVLFAAWSLIALAFDSGC